MTNDNNDTKVRLLLKQIELPDRAYEAAQRRYKDLGAWFSRPDSQLREADPHIFVQGSFALGTAIRPVVDGQEYDLDLSCKLRRGVDRSSHTQLQLKEMVGKELEGYRAYRNIHERLESKHRCWRLAYRDELPFHMDVVPGLLADISRRQHLTKILLERGASPSLAADIAAEAVWITDDRSPYFKILHPEWPSSNPEGFVRWFVSRMDGGSRLLTRDAQIDDVPLYKRKSPLQEALQILKGHRDVMFESACDRKPISVILTTISAEAYKPGESLIETLGTLLNAFDVVRLSSSDFVLNPVNPQENFADRWRTQEGQRLDLKGSFHRWILQVRADFAYLLEQADAHEVVKRARSGWKVALDEQAVKAALYPQATAASAFSPRRVTIERAPKPWST